MRELDAQGRAGTGLGRHADEAHAGFPGRTSPLADVASDAGTDDVLPGRAAAPAPGKDVIERQLAGCEPFAAVLAAVAVTREDVAPVELHLLAWEAVIRQEPDDAGNLDLEVDG